MKPIDHNHLIKQAAKLELKPIGCMQKGRSRTWLDDQGWWVGVVEFQPHSGGKGSYLNVGACWLWHDKDYLSFDDGHRVEAFREFIDAPQFAQDARFLAVRAREEVLKLRLKYPSIHACAERLRVQEMNSEWRVFDAAVAAGLSGDAPFAEKQFAKVLQMACRTSWQQDLHSRAANLCASVHDAERFKLEITHVVWRRRTLLKLPVLEAEGNLFG